MLIRKKAFFVLFLLGAVTWLSSGEVRGVLAQDGRNTFQIAQTTSPPRPKSDELTRQRLAQAFQQEFSSRSDGSYAYFFALFAFLAVLIAVLVYYDFLLRQRNKLGFDDPWYLFKELCSAHRLTAAERKFLRDLAEDMNLEDPLPLFIEPDYFYQALGDFQFARSGQVLRYLLNKLFDIKLGASEAPLHSTPSDESFETTVLVPPAQSHGNRT